MPMSPRLLRPRAAGGFDPRAIANLGLWLDASDASSYTVATGVSEWRDKSGGNRHFSQTTANNQPAVSTINGKSAFSFDGSNDTLSGNEAARDLFRNTPGATIIVVYENNQGGTLLGVVSPSQATRQYCAVGSGSNAFYAFSGRRLDSDSNQQVTTGASGPILQGVAAVGGYAVNYSNATCSLRHNGMEQVSAAFQTAGNTSDTRSNAITVGSIFSQFFNGKIAAMLYYQRALTSTEIAPLERWLGSQWGIAVA